MNAIATIIFAVIAIASVMAAPGGEYGHQDYGHQEYGHQQAYSAPHYSAPHYSAPHSYSYPSPAPHVKCGSNLLVGCAPNVAHVPCQSYHHSSSYSKPSAY